MRKQSIVCFVRKGWNIRVGDFGMVEVPLANIDRKKKRSLRKVRITVEECSNDEIEGALIENQAYI